MIQLICVFQIALQFISLSESAPDSIEIWLSKLSSNHISSPQDKINEGLILLDIENLSAEQAILANVKIARGYFSLGRYDEAIQYYQSAIKIIQANRQYNMRPLVLNGLAKTYSYGKNEYNKALNLYLKALKTGKKYGKSIEIADSYNGLGSVYFFLDEHEKATEYYKKALTTVEKAKAKDGDESELKAGRLNYMCNLAMMDSKRGNYDKAIKKFAALSNEAYQNNRPHLLNVCFLNKGELYEMQEDYQKAFESYYAALKIARTIEMPLQTILALRHIGSLYKVTGRSDSAIAVYKEANEIADSIDSKATLLLNYKDLSRIYSEAGDYKMAFECLRKFNYYNKEVFSEKMSKNIADIETKYEIERKELQLQRQRNLRNYLIVFAFLVLVLVIVVYSRYRLKRRTNLMLEEQNLKLDTMNKRLLKSESDLRKLNATKDRFFSIISHDLKNPFGTLKSVTQMLSENYFQLKDDHKLKIAQTINSSVNLTYNLLENLLHWSVAQTGDIRFNPEKFDMRKLTNQTLSLLQLKANEKNITLSSSIKQDTFVYADRNMIAVVMRNLLINALTYSKQGSEVEVFSTFMDGKVKVCVKDQGPGISKAAQDNLFRIDAEHRSIGVSKGNKGTGLGLILCREFIEKNNGTISLESEEGKGSTFSFILKSAP